MGDVSIRGSCRCSCGRTTEMTDRRRHPGRSVNNTFELPGNIERKTAAAVRVHRFVSAFVYHLPPLASGIASPSMGGGLNHAFFLTNSIPLKISTHALLSSIPPCADRVLISKAQLSATAGGK